MNYIPAIGLEVHVQLKTDSKIFCSCSTAFGSEPNSQVCPVCLGLPGVLPVLNERVVELAVRAALSLDCRINPLSVFARKNYFYPDLPKGYQISQFEEPLAEHGWLDIETGGMRKKIGITRIHLEEDAGKSMHPEGREHVNESRIDINRCGVPLIEIVSEPDIATPREAHDYLSRLKQILLYLGVSDCNMEEGSLRCDANVSLRPEDSERLGTKTELKNLNSFRFVEKALMHEIRRQQEILESGESVQQQTLSWDSANNTVVLMRTKEESDDYRYFPEPDLIPLRIGADWIERIKGTVPELPAPKKERFVRQYGLTDQNAEVLTASRELADYYEETVSGGADHTKACNWILGEVLGVLNERKIVITEFPVRPANLTGLLKLLDGGTISGKIAKNVFQEMIDTGESAGAIVKRRGLEQITDDDTIVREVETVLKNSEDEVRAYLGGKTKIMGFFVGQVMKATRGKANPSLVNKILKEKLDSLKTSS